MKSINTTVTSCNQAYLGKAIIANESNFEHVIAEIKLGMSR